MKIINDKYEEYGVYNINEEIQKLDEIIGISLPELAAELFLMEKEIIPVDKVLEYCENNFTKLHESKFQKTMNDEIIERRVDDYEILYKRTKIYRDKGLELINVILYLQGKNPNPYLEEIIKELDIKHYNNIVSGRDLIRILETLQNIFENYKISISRINSLETYNNPNFDTFYKTSRHAYPNPSLLNDEDYYDRTSLTRTKKRNRK